MTAPLSWDISDAGVMEVTLAQQPYNEIGEPMLAALESVVEAVNAQAPKGLLFKSDLKGGFSAGADLRALHAGLVSTPDAASQESQLRSFIERIHAAFDAIDQLPIPVVAALHGVCFGGGLELALLADIRVAEPSLRIAFPELRLGLVPGFGGLPRLKRETSEAFARELILTGRSHGIARAIAVGFVHQKAAAGRGVDMARRLLEQILRNDPAAYADAKAFTKSLPEEELRRERELFVQQAMRPTLRAALDDFTSRKDPLPWLPSSKH